jgi:DNA polymerase
MKQPPGDSSFVLTYEMKAGLLALGLRTDEIARLTPRQVQLLLSEPNRPAPAPSESSTGEGRLPELEEVAQPTIPEAPGDQSPATELESSRPTELSDLRGTTAIDQIASLPGTSIEPARFFFDIETRARLNLRAVGSARYLRDAETQIRLICWALDDGPVQVWREGDPIEPLLAAVKLAGRFVAHNLPFDRAAWNLHMVPLGLPEIPLELCEDTSAMCRAIGIPASLEDAAKVLLPPEFHKAPKNIVDRMSRPRRPWPGEDPNELHWVDDPEGWAEYIAYCKQDVEAMRALYRVLPALPEIEHQVWIHDQIDNERGLYLDGVAIAKACEVVDTAKPKANAQLRDLTGGEIETTDQHEKIRLWVNAHGGQLTNMQAKSVQAELERLERAELLPEVRRILELRLESAQAAAAKPIRMRAWRCEDGRARQTLIYHQASTGRWAGTGVQFQNVKKEGDEIARKFAAILNSDQNIPLKDIGDASRGFVCEEPDYELFGGDFSGFESAYLAAVSGERWKVEAWIKFFRTRDPHDDPYFIIGKWLGFADDVARQYGKVADLAFGYGGLAGAWKRFAPAGDAISDEQIKRYCKIWRDRHPAIVRFWYGLHDAAIAAVRTPSVPQTYKRHRLYCRQIGNLNFLSIELPSGRAIAYPNAHLVYGVHNGRQTEAIGFMDNAQGQWKPYVSPTGKLGSWHGLLTENVVQAGTRDIMAAAILRLEAAGYEVVLTVHDEIICRVRKGERPLKKFKQLLEQPPDWAEAMGMPLSAKVWQRERWADVNIPVEHVSGGVITPDMLVKPLRIKPPDHLRLKEPAKPSSRAKAKRPSPASAPAVSPADEVEHADTAARVAPCSSPEPAPTHQPSMPMMITQAMKAQLRGNGYTDEQIRNMTPGEALNILRQAPTEQPASEPNNTSQTAKRNGRAAPEPPPSPSGKLLVPDRAETDRFLALLDSTTTQFTFQTFDDNKERKSPKLARVLHGTLDEHFAELTRLNNLGAGVFVTINETDLKGRTIENIVRVRYLFGDFDNGAPLPRDGPRRCMDVQSSSTGRHGYWRPNGIRLEDFRPTQELIARRFNGDSTVKDLPRVMRLPGFWHRKGEPFMTRIIEVYEDAPACSVADFETDEIKYQAKPSSDQTSAFDGQGGPWTILNALALANLDKWVPALFGDAAVYQQGTGAYRVSSKALGRNLEEDLSIHPTGIIDFGVADQGDGQQGKRTPINVIMEFRNVDANTAFDWLDLLLRGSEKPKSKPWRRAPIHEWIGKPVPQPRYTVADRILAEQVFLLSGEGGTGKSGMVEQLCAAHIIAREWLGGLAQQGPGIYVECEDNEDAFWWRLATFAEYYNVPMEVFVKDLHLFSLVNENSILAATNKHGIVEPTAAFHHLYEMAGDIKPVQIGIASVANVFAGSEINRTEVQQFLKLMNRIPAVTKGSLVLVAQPSLTGLASTNLSHQGLSGTTQWHNGVRNRAAVEHIKPKEGENIADTGLRSISFFKNQYGPPAAACYVRWQDGMFRPVEGVAKSANERARAAENLTITLLKRFTTQNRNVSINPNPNNYAPKTFAETAEAEAAGITKTDFKKAIERLLQREVIENKEFHPPGKSKKDIHWRLEIRETDAKSS